MVELQDYYINGFILLFMTGSAIILNCCCIASLAKNRHRLPPYMFLVLNLSISDVIFAILGFAIRSPGLIILGFYELAPPMLYVCVTAMFIYFPIIVSINTMILFLTFDRFLAIVLPLRHKNIATFKTVKRAIIFTWLFCGLMLAAYPMIVLIDSHVDLSEWYLRAYGRCSFSRTERGFVLYLTGRILFLILPSFITLVFYILMLITLRRRDIKSKRQIKKNNETTHRLSLVPKKSVLTISIILFLYFITYLPSVFLRDIPAIITQYSDHTVKFSDTVTSATSIAFYVSALTDPIVYIIRSRYIFITAKKTVRQIFRIQPPLKDASSSVDGPKALPGKNNGTTFPRTPTVILSPSVTSDMYCIDSMAILPNRSTETIIET